MFDIESIQALYNGKAVRYTKHYFERLEERNISRGHVTQAIMSGEIIEEIPDDEPLPSVLILGYNENSEPLHVAVSIDDARVWLVTTYRPTLDIWESDYKTRRVIT